MKILNKIIDKKQIVLSNKILKTYKLYLSNKNENNKQENLKIVSYLLDLNTNYSVKSMFIRGKNKFINQVKFIIEMNKTIRDLDSKLIGG